MPLLLVVLYISAAAAEEGAVARGLCAAAGSRQGRRRRAARNLVRPSRCCVGGAAPSTHCCRCSRPHAMCNPLNKLLTALACYPAAIASERAAGRVHHRSGRAV